MKTYRKLALYVALAAIIGSVAAARAAERVTLRSGSALVAIIRKI